MRKILTFSLIAVIGLAFSSCADDGDYVDVATVNQKTTLVFMPWTGSTSGDAGLYNAFRENLDSINSAITKNKGINGRLMVFLSESASQSKLYEVTYGDSGVVYTEVQKYTGNNYANAAGITQIVNDVKSAAEALNYSLIIGCHGCGWTYKDDWTNYPYEAKRHHWTGTSWMGAKGYHTQGSPYLTTRFFGSVSDPNYAIDIETLAEGLKGAGFGSPYDDETLGQKKLQYILFDDCYMANVETAYALKDVTNFLIASTSEVLAKGMPYATIWTQLASTTPNYETIVSGFNSFYSAFQVPSGALSVIDCREVDGLAALMKEFNKRYHMADSTIDHLQVLDGFQMPLFYDMGNYVDSLCTDGSWLSDFHAQLDKVVRSTKSTDSLYTYLYYKPFYIPVKHYSGITISDPSRSPVAIRGKEKTAWWKGTH